VKLAKDGQERHRRDHESTIATRPIHNPCVKNIGNVSAAANAIRPALQKQGVALTATLPQPLTHTRFKEPSMAHLWALRAIQ
jgi:hypothetical protein